MDVSAQHSVLAAQVRSSLGLCVTLAGSHLHNNLCHSAFAQCPRRALSHACRRRHAGSQHALQPQARLGHAQDKPLHDHWHPRLHTCRSQWAEAWHFLSARTLGCSARHNKEAHSKGPSWKRWRIWNTWKRFGSHRLNSCMRRVTSCIVYPAAQIGVLGSSAGMTYADKSMSAIGCALL